MTPKLRICAAMALSAALAACAGAPGSGERTDRTSAPREVTLARDSSGSLGLSIAGGRGSALGNVPITVASLTSHGPALLCGEIKVGTEH